MCLLNLYAYRHARARGMTHFRYTHAHTRIHHKMAQIRLHVVKTLSSNRIDVCVHVVVQKYAHTQIARMIEHFERRAPSALTGGDYSQICAIIIVVVVEKIQTFCRCGNRYTAMTRCCLYLLRRHLWPG